MLRNQDWKSNFAMLSNAERYLAIFYYMDFCYAETDRRTETFFLYLAYNLFFS